MLAQCRLPDRARLCYLSRPAPTAPAFGFTRVTILYTFSIDMQKMTITEATTREPGASDGAGLTLPRAQSLAAMVAEFIVDGIASGAFQFGQRLVETDLARQLNVSRVPIREAIKMLEAQGILLVIPHRGAYIAEFDERKIERICQARAALENLALPDALAARRPRPARLASLETLTAGREGA